MVIKKKCLLIITYRQDKKKSNVVDQISLLRKTIPKHVVDANCTERPKMWQNCKEYLKNQNSKGWSKEITLMKR